MSAEAKRRACILIGDCWRDADRAARNAGWTRFGPRGWTDQVGQEIIYVPYIDQLRGYDRDTVVYLSRGWHTVVTENELQIRFDQKDFECL